ncbi:Succinyl-CoA:(R)-benzylsuccinate CoA-transferase subunit BbsF [compost metagenome]
MFKRWAKIMGRPELLDDPRFADDELRGQHGSLLSELMAEWCGKRSREEALEELAAAKIPAGPVYSPAEVHADQAIADSGAFVWLQHPQHAKAPYVAAPLNLSRTPLEIKRHAPLVGEHTEEILSEFGFNAEEIKELRHNNVV